MRKKKLLITLIVFVLTLIIGGIVIAAVFFKWETPFNIISSIFNITISKQKLLKQADFWVYDINFSEGSDLDELVESNFDVLVLDIADVSKEDVKKLHEKKGRLVLCYVSIGQAESYRDYWQDDWEEGNPEWLFSEDPDWLGNYNIKFWTSEWKEIIAGGEGSYVDEIVEAGFDGVYLDTAGVDFWQNSDIVDAEEEMILQVEEISDYAKSRDFLLVVQNLGFFENDYSERLQDKIDGVAQEEVFYGHENKDGVSTLTSVTRHITSKLEEYKGKDLPVFVVDYPLQCESSEECYNKENLERMRDSYERGWQNDFIMYNQNRILSGVTPVIPRIYDMKVEYEKLPLLLWSVLSGNSSDASRAFRIFVASSKEKLQNDDPDIYDSGKMWSRQTIFDFIPDKEIEEGTYYWKVIVYEHINGVGFISPWSEVGEFDYKRITPDKNYSSETTLFQTAWIPNWGFANGFESLKQNKNHLESISPVWFEVAEDGTLRHTTYYNNEEFMQFCQDNDIKLIPSVPIFDPEVLNKILNNNLEAHVDAIYQESKKYDGIDLDYEATNLSDKDLYFDFLQKLSKKLHKDNKKLSITVLSKWTEAEIYGWRPETREVQDWKEIAKYADEIRIMAYDYTGQTSYIPGPLSPIYWDELILAYAVERIPREKIVLALPLYGYSFRVDEKSNIGTDIWQGGEKYGSKRRILAYTYEDIAALEEEFELSYSFDNYNAEKAISYNDGRYDRILYINDAEAIKAKKDLAKKYGIKGIAYWRMGGEGESVFNDQ